MRYEVIKLWFDLGDLSELNRYANDGWMIAGVASDGNQHWALLQRLLPATCGGAAFESAVSASPAASTLRERVREALSRTDFILDLIATEPSFYLHNSQKILDAAVSVVESVGATQGDAPATNLDNLINAAVKLLEWCPKCSIGSSGYIRQQKLREAIDNFKEPK